MKKSYFALHNSDNDLMCIVSVEEETDKNIIDKALFAIAKKCCEKVVFVQKYNDSIMKHVIKIEILFDCEEREFNHTETFSLTPLDIL